MSLRSRLRSLYSPIHSRQRRRNRQRLIPQSCELLERRNLLTVLFSDSFDATSFDPALWSDSGNATIDDVGRNEPSAPYAARINGNTGQGDVLTSTIIDLTGETNVTLSFRFQKKGDGNPPEIGNNLLLEFRNAAGDWITLDTRLGVAPVVNDFGHVAVELPGDALHANFQFRFRSVGFTGPSDLDDWFVDDVVLQSETGAVGEEVKLTDSQQGDLFYPNIVEINFNDVAVPASGGVLTITATGDFGSFLDSLELRADGEYIDHLFVVDGKNGEPVTVQLLLPQDLLERLAEDGSITLSFRPSIGVGNRGPTELTVELNYTGLPSDTAPPEVQSVELGADGQTITVQLNDDDLDPASVSNLDNYRLLKANGDANGDGDFFNDGDETVLDFESIGYDSASDQISLKTLDRLFGDQYQFVLDGDDAASDGSAGLTDLAGNLLAGGDVVTQFDRTPRTITRELRELTTELNLTRRTERLLTRPLDRALHLMNRERANPRAVAAQFQKYLRRLEKAVQRGHISQADHDRMSSMAEQLMSEFQEQAAARRRALLARFRQFRFGYCRGR